MTPHGSRVGRSRRLAPMVVLALCLAGAAPLVPVDVGAAPGNPSVAGPGVISDAPEYFTDIWNDPMDMSNEEDFDVTPGRRAAGVSVAMGGGIIDYTTRAAFGRLYFVDSEPTELNAVGHREANEKPVDTRAFRRMSIRAWTDREVVAYIVWNRCTNGAGGADCQGTKAVRLRPGWRTYDLDMTGANDIDSYTDPGLPTSVSGASWTGGGVVQLSLQPSVAGVVGVRGLIDNVRLYEPGVALQTVSVAGTGVHELWYDTDSDPSNNGTSADQGAGAGYLGPVGPGATTVDLGRIPPGPYRFVTSQGGARSAPSGGFAIDAAPRPVVVDPDISGAGDWATEVRGDPFDFENTDDVFRMFDGGPSYRNADAGFWGGALHLTSAGQWDDPQLYLTDAAWHNPMLDAEEWHRISWRMAYDGTWGTNAVPGEGLDMRFCWQGLGGAASCSLDLFPKLGWTNYAVDLKTPNPASIEAPGYSGIGFGGGASKFVQLLRIDPHEDPGYRAWHLDNVRISHNDRIPVNGTFAITFRDDAWEQGTTAEIFVDSGPQPGLGDLIEGGRPVSPGDNVVQWAGAGYGPGEYTVRVRLTDPRGVQRWSASTGPVEIPDPNKWKPYGSFDVAAARGKEIYVAGWAADPDAVRAGTAIHVYVDGRGYDLGAAVNPRGDLAASRTDLAAFHGFSAQVPGGDGNHQVCAYAINIGHGSNTQLGCKNVLVK